MAERLAAGELPPLTRALADVLAARVLVPAGRVELEVQAQTVIYVWRHERITASQLAVFDQVDATQVISLLEERLRRYRAATGSG